jgi:hypothetical protein
MQPKQVKDLFVAAVEANDPVMAWEGVKAIVADDMYINIHAGGWTNPPRKIITEWGYKPCQGSCKNKLIPIGTEVMWVKGVGVWHVECWDSRHEL